VFKFNYKALSIGVLFYLFCAYILSLIIAISLFSLFESLEYEKFLKKYEDYMELLFWYLSIFSAGYVTCKKSNDVKQSIVLGALICFTSLFGTLSATYDAMSEQYLDLLFDILVIPVSSLGGYLLYKRSVIGTVSSIISTMTFLIVIMGIAMKDFT
jgi:cation transport ATPase